MEPTYRIGQSVQVDRHAYDSARPHVGDVVIFQAPQGAVDGSRCGIPVKPDQLCSLPTPEEGATRFIKRAVAGPGDTVAVIDGHTVRNGQPQTETFARPCAGGELCTFRTPIKVPPGYWFMMGDNRGQSDDSRFWGPVPTAWIIGKVVK